MLDHINSNGGVDVDNSHRRVLVGPIVSLDSSSVTEFTNHSARRSIITNYDYTQYDADAAHRDEVRATIVAAEVEDYDSILDDGGFGIHKSRPVADDEFEETKLPRRQVNKLDSAKSKHSTDAEDSVSQQVKKSSVPKISRILFSGKKAKGGINGYKENFATTPETDASSRPSLLSNKSFSETKTPIVANGRGTPSLTEPPIIPIASPHIPPRKARSNQLLKKILAMKEDEGSASTARLTDDDTSSEEDINSISATREPKETLTETPTGTHESVCAINKAAQKIFMGNVAKYNCFFSSTSSCVGSEDNGSEDAVVDDEASIMRIASIPYDEMESNTGIALSQEVTMQQKDQLQDVMKRDGKGATVQQKDQSKDVAMQQKDNQDASVRELDHKAATVQEKDNKESCVSGLACINKFDARQLSYDFYERSLCDDEESVANDSVDSLDSLIRKETFGFDPCGVGEMMEDISDAIHDIANVFSAKPEKRHSGTNTSERKRTGRHSFNREEFEHVMSQRRLV